MVPPKTLSYLNSWLSWRDRSTSFLIVTIILKSLALVQLPAYAAQTDGEFLVAAKAAAKTTTAKTTELTQDQAEASVGVPGLADLPRLNTLPETILPNTLQQGNQPSQIPSASTSSANQLPVSPVRSRYPESSGYPAVDSYRLGAGDVIRLEVFRLPDYSGEYEVLINGALNLPMVGQVIVSRLTLEEAEQTVSQAYSARLRRPIVDMFLVNPRPLRIGVAGEVSRPGEYILQREGTQFPSLVNALETAGGITQSADLRQIVVQRENAAGTETIVANLWQFLNTGNLSYNIALRDGDTVYIPTRDTFDSGESLQLAAASFAADGSQPINVAVVGEVFRPGPHTVTSDERSRSGEDSAQPTVTRAIQTAGGIQPNADIRAVQVYRRGRDGTQRVIDVNLWQLLADGNITEDIVLQEGDTIIIPRAETVVAEEVAAVASASFSPATIRVNVVGEVDRPGSVEVPPNTPLSQGVLAAGGFNNRARRTQVELIRLNPNGTATRSSIDVDFAQGIDESENPLLRNNDVVVVGRSGTAALSDTLDSVVRPLGRALSLFTIPTSIFNLFD